jgi:hypothetical protein
MRPVLLALTLAVAVAGCGRTTIDGFKIGQPAKCSPPVGPGAGPMANTCVGFPDKAIAALDAREPGHAAIESMEMYLDARSTAVIVFVFKLADGSTKATGVACSLGPGCVGVGSYPAQ